MGQAGQRRMEVDVHPYVTVILIKYEWINFQLKDKHQTGFKKLNQIVLRLLYLRLGRGSLAAQMVKESSCNTGDLGLIPGSGRSPGERNGNPLQQSCMENSMDKEVWQATVHGVAKSRT